ncbi:baseplate hub and tail lysozyme [Synechococcus phage S-SM2]|uniref:T4-like baseplate hub and tail lysozyme n=1 Tax=Synechococcus phage S-SM2 TaxID=444860 RepID=E3SIR2_9CAUD|nr:baseplate hub and tail lysozyme [Synechococcus phage S-SM2]ADO97360.1 T4-like baseplate hub and tail lysozyme [Synechococcus phage S-SM2]
MAEGAALFDPGFLGTQFVWWLGQVADDSEWRDNILPGKFEDANSIPGWGRRYKVRIMGIHDKEEESIPSDQLPWASVMYPITAGGGQTGASQTPMIRQGNMVFGFFMDGQDQQVPVIMGIMGHNAQTPMTNKIGTTESNFGPTSGYAEGKRPATGNAKPIAPDDGLVIKKPTDPSLAAALAPPPPGVQLNKFGLRPDQPLSAIPGGLQVANDAREAARNAGASPQEVEDAAMKAVADHTAKIKRQQESPSSPSTGNPTKENPDAVHQLAASDTKREAKIKECIVVMKPDPDQFVQSSVSAIQTTIKTLTERLNSYLSAISSYVDAVSSTIENVQKLISDAACQIAKYMKVLFDKMMEYVLKILNKALTAAVAALPTHMRSMFGDMKEQITELILCLYGKLTGNLCGMIQGILDDALDMGNAEQKARENVDNPQNDQVKRQPEVGTCYAEDVIGQVMYANKQAIDDANNNLLDNINSFLEDIQNELAGVSGTLSDVTNLLGGISGSMTSALTFSNISLNVFGCELSPNLAVSDSYCMANGGSATEDAALPSEKSIENATNRENDTAREVPVETPFASPPTSQPDIDLDTPITQEERDAVAQGNIIDEEGNTIGTIS